MCKSELFWVFCSFTCQATPLHLACGNGHIRTVKELISKYEVDTTCRDKDGRNYLDYAIDNNHKYLFCCYFAFQKQSHSFQRKLI